MLMQNFQISELLSVDDCCCNGKEDTVTKIEKFEIEYQGVLFKNHPILVCSSHNLRVII